MLQVYVTVSSNINVLHYLSNKQKEAVKHAVKHELYLLLLII